MAIINLGQLTFLTLVADANTPAQYTQYNGLRLSIPQAVALPPPGEYSTLTASGVTVYGSTRIAAGGALEWLMTAAVDPAIALVNALVAGGWASETARVGYLNSANYLLGQGITAATLWPGLKNFYDWAVLDLQAKGWRGP